MDKETKHTIVEILDDKISHTNYEIERLQRSVKYYENAIIEDAVEININDKYSEDDLVNIRYIIKRDTKEEKKLSINIEKYKMALNDILKTMN